MSERKKRYMPTTAENIDRLVISSLKELKIPEYRGNFTREINDIVHDLDLDFEDKKVMLTGNLVRDIVILAVMNNEIWHNESNFRKGIKEGNDLELTHGLNGIRNVAKNKIQTQVDNSERKDYKIDNVKAYPQWIPSGYEEKNKEEEE